MPHPVSLPPPVAQREALVLCPVLDAPYKMLGQRLTDLTDAMEIVRREEVVGAPRLLLTITEDEALALGLRRPEWVHLLGRLSPSELRAVQQSARVIVYPTTLESFGYPLAEARLARQPVVAPDTSHAREVAGDALVPYSPTDPGSLVVALSEALKRQLPGLVRNPFDPDAYFNRLLSTA